MGLEYGFKVAAALFAERRRHFRHFMPFTVGASRRCNFLDAQHPFAAAAQKKISFAAKN